MYSRIKKLAELSYTKGNLDAEKAYVIAGALSRRDLKLYIKELKKHESKRIITIVFPSKQSQENLRRLQNIFQDKQLETITDPSLLIGIKIIDNDLVHDFSLKHSFDSITSHVEETV